MMMIFDVIADPTRRRILDLLLQQPRLVGELVDALGITQPGVSKQLRVLRDAGLVDVHPDGQRRKYVLNAEPLQEIDRWLADYRDMWSARFDRLDDYLDQLKQEGQDNDNAADTED